MGPQGEKCADCYFFEPSKDAGWGECHVRSPQPGGTMPFIPFPERRSIEWCGQFQKRVKTEVKKK